MTTPGVKGQRKPLLTVLRFAARCALGRDLEMVYANKPSKQPRHWVLQWDAYIEVR